MRMLIRKSAAVLFRSLIGIALLVVLIILIDVRSVLSLFWDANVALVGIVFLWLFFDRVLTGWRWIILVRSKVKDVSVGELFRLFFISSFLGNFLPLNLGSDATRVVALGRRIGNAVEPLSSVILDRFLGFISLVIPVVLILIVTALTQASLLTSQIIWLAVALSGMIIATGICVLKRRSIFDLTVTNQLGQLAWFSDKVGAVVAACMAHDRSVIFRVFAIVQVSLFNAILTTYLLSIAFGMDVTIIDFFIVVPIITFLGQLPISPSGLGISEGAFVFFFTQVGASAAEALALGLAMRVLMTLGSLPGGVLLIIQNGLGGTCQSARRAPEIEQ